MEKSFWWKFFTIMFLVDLLIIAAWSYLDLRPREYHSVTQINFPLRRGWVVEIRTDEMALLTVASSGHLFLQKVGSIDPQDIIVAKPSVRPVNYEDDGYFLAQKTVLSSDWIVQETFSAAEGRLERFQENTDLHVRIYPQRCAVIDTVCLIIHFLFMISCAVTGTVWIARL